MLRLLIVIPLVGFCLISVGLWQVNAQVQRIRILSPTYITEVPSGLQVAITAAESLNDYTAQQHGDRFQLIIPRASISVFEGNIYKGRIVNISTERRGSDAVFLFKFSPDYAARIKPGINRLDIFVTRNESAKIEDSSALPSNVNKSLSPAPSSANKETAKVPIHNTRTSPPAILAIPPATTSVKNAGETMAGNNGVVPPPQLTNRPDSANRAVRIQRVSRAPRLEDFLNNTPRQAETEITDFRQWTPNDGDSATRQTKAYLSYDDSNLYVVFVCKETPDQIRAHMAKREAINSDDNVRVMLDTFHDRRRAYVFIVNPLGIQRDGITAEGQNDDYSFDTLWHSKGQLTADGYVVWMAIPFKSLRFSNDAVQSWGIALGRSIRHKNEEVYYPHITQREQGFIRQAATLNGIEKISSGRNIQLTPYNAFSTERALDTSGENPVFRTRNEIRGGMDAKIVFRNAITLDLTFNPDFSQVESDEPQVTINRRYETFFPEKRPFFIENANFFSTPENLFFSRRIIEPEFGARFTGKLGKWAVGGLAIDDRAPGKLVSPSDADYRRRAFAGVFRVQREFGEQSSIGALITSYNFGASSNRVYSLDARHKLNKNWFFSGQLMRSYNKRSNGSRLSGPAYLANLSRSGERFNYNLTYTDRSRDFRSRLGFIRRVDVRSIDQYASYEWRPQKFGINRIVPSGYGSANWNRQGHLQDWYAGGGLSIELTNLTGIKFDRSESYELYLDKGFRTENNSISVYSDKLDWLSLYGGYNWGTTINYSPPNEISPFKADSSGGYAGLSFRPNTQIRFDQSYIYSSLSKNGDEFILGSDAPASIFYNHIFRSKLNYQFNRELSLRAIIDYNAVLPNPSLINLERDKRLTSDVLLTYLINPGTALYIGYTDLRENLLIAPETSSLIHTKFPITSTGRKVFVKFSYFFQY